MGVIYLQDSSDTSLTTCLHVAGKFLSVTACNGELEGRVDNSYFFLSCSPLMVIFESVTFFLLLFCQQGGCVDSRHQSLALLYMILGQRDVSKLLTGPLTPYT